MLEGDLNGIVLNSDEVKWKISADDVDEKGGVSRDQQR